MVRVGARRPGHDESNEITRITLNRNPIQWPSSSPKNNPCCATARAALSATRRRCRICVSLRDSKDATGFSRDLWKAFAEMGFSGLLVPENFGGSGLGCVEAGVVMEEIGRTLMPSPFLSTAVLAASALVARRQRGAEVRASAEDFRRLAAGRARGRRRRKTSPAADQNAGGALRQRFQAQRRQGLRGRRPHRRSPDRRGAHRAAPPASATG